MFIIGLLIGVTIGATLWSIPIPEIEVIYGNNYQNMP